jgi:CelD/BcsL family acetyltransferase involved in cellulose biosynthesis
MRSRRYTSSVGASSAPSSSAASGTQSAPGPTTAAAGAIAGLRVTLKTVDELDAGDRRAWQELAARAAEPNPFFEPALLLPALAHLTAGDLVLLTLVYDADELIWVAPISFRRRWRRLSLRNVTTWCHTHCFLGAPLTDDDRVEAAWRLVLDAVAARRPRPRMLILELLPTDGVLFAALQRAAGSRRVSRYEAYTRAVLRRRSLVGDTAPQRGRHRRELERRSRLVEQKTGAPFTTRDISTDPGAIEGFLDLEVEGWTGRIGTALSSNPNEASFARDAARALRSEGRLVLLATSSGAGVAAELFAVRSARTLFMFKIAFSEEVARFSPGTHLVRDMTRWFAARTELDCVDSCAAPHNEFINRLLPDRRPLATVLVSLDRVGAAATVALPPLVNCRRWVRRWTRKGRRP